MGMKNEKYVEDLLRGGTFSAPAHKETLRTKLFAQSSELSLDELDSVVGGKGSRSKKDYVNLECPYCHRKGNHEKISGFEARCCYNKNHIINLKAM